MTREWLAAWMFLCVPLWTALAAWNLSQPNPKSKIAGAILMIFAGVGLEVFLACLLHMAVRP